MMESCKALQCPPEALSVAKAGPLPRRGSSLDNVGPPSGTGQVFLGAWGPGVALVVFGR